MTRAQLEAPGELFANIAKTILLADAPAFPFTPYAHREFGSAMANNRVEITGTSLGRASDHMQFGNVANSTTAYYDHHSVRLAFDVFSVRATQQTTDNHAYCIGRLGYLCSRDAQRFNPAACQNLVVLDIVDRGSSPVEPDKTDSDHSLCTFEITYQIPPTVFSAAT